MRFLSYILLALAMIASTALNAIGAPTPPADFRLDSGPPPAAPPPSEPLPAEPIGTTTSISQYGITWTFAEPVQYGQFVNGDYWMVDPGGGVKITNISPGHKVVNGRTMNGSMLNPTGANQGFDSARQYDVNLNVGIGVSAGSPLTLHANNSLVTAISNEVQGGSTHISYTKTAAILTCLSSVPPAGSLRPAYSGTNKILYNANNLNRSLLAKLPVPASAPDPVAYANNLQRSWLMHSGAWTARFMHPSDNIPNNYYYTVPLSIAAILLHLDFTDAQKEALLINFVQHGIDLYGAIASRGFGFTSEAGLGFGRKWPILFAGIMLNDANIKGIAAKTGQYLYSGNYGPGNPPPGYLRFAEDSLIFYVSQADVDRTNSSLWAPDARSGTPYPYTRAMIGMPEWGHRYVANPYQVDSAWYAIYRTIGSGIRGHIGMTLAARIMGAQDLWNHPAHFDFVDRYQAIAKGDPDPFGYQVVGERAGWREGGFLGEMWDRYRRLY